MEKNGRYVTHQQMLLYVITVLALFGGFFAWYASGIDRTIDLKIKAAINGQP